jgi:hypothetical protein
VANQQVRELARFAGKPSEGALCWLCDSSFQRKGNAAQSIVLHGFNSPKESNIFEACRQPVSDGWGSSAEDSEARARATAAVRSVLAPCRQHAACVIRTDYHDPN